MSALGDFIRDARQAIGFTQKQLSAKANVSEQMLSDVENGKRRLSPETLRSVCSALRCDYDDGVDAVLEDVRAEYR